MDLLKTLTASTYATMRNKARLVDREGVGSDIPPQAALYRDSGVPEHLYLLPPETGPILLGVIVSLSDLPIAAFSAEVFTHVGDGFDGDPTHLDAAFAAGDPNVVEAIEVTMMANNGELLRGQWAYTYDGRTVRPAAVMRVGAVAVDNDAWTHALQAGFAERSTEVLLPAEIGERLHIDHAGHSTRVSNN